MVKTKNSYMETIKVYSPLNDKNIKKNINNSPIWSKCYHEDELDNAKKKHKDLYCYQMKFDGLKPVQVTKISKFQ